MVHPRSDRLKVPVWSAVLAAVLGTVLMFAASVALARWVPVSLGLDVPLRLMIVVASLFLAVPSVLALLAHRVPLIAGLGLEPLPRRMVLLAVAAGLGLWIFSLGLIELQYAVWPPPPDYLERFRRLHEALRPAGPLDAVWSAIAIAAAPALFEEITVRGVLLPSLRPALGATAAVGVSAAAFALRHDDPYRFAFTFAVGAALGTLRLRTGSLWVVILAHGTLNLLTFAAAPWLDDPSQPLPDPKPWLGAGLLLLGGALSAAIFL
jgi:membrane protease YdiL (CAAX protease family)